MAKISFWQQDVPSPMSVDVINRCLRDKQVLVEKNTLGVVITGIQSCVGTEAVWYPFQLCSPPLAPPPKPLVSSHGWTILL